VRIGDSFMRQHDNPTVLSIGKVDREQIAIGHILKS